MEKKLSKWRDDLKLIVMATYRIIKYYVIIES